jgi:hypothetical protein
MNQEEKKLFENYINFFDGVFTGIQLVALERPNHILRWQVKEFYLLSVEEMIKMNDDEILNRWTLIPFSVIQEKTQKEGNPLKVQACEEFLESSVLHLIGM